MIGPALNITSSYLSEKRKAYEAIFNVGILNSFSPYSDASAERQCFGLVYVY